MTVAKKRSVQPKVAKPPHVPEKDFQKQVLDMATMFGWSWHHETFALGSKPGYPDLTLVHPRHGTLWLELKASNGKPSLAQIAWIDRLVEAGQKAYIVYPTDSDFVAALLRGEDAEQRAA